MSECAGPGIHSVEPVFGGKPEMARGIFLDIMDQVGTEGILKMGNVLEMLDQVLTGIILIQSPGACYPDDT